MVTVPFSVLLRGIRGQPTPAPLGTWVWLGSLVLEGDAYVAPTRIFPGPLGLAYKGASWGTFRFVPHLNHDCPLLHRPPGNHDCPLLQCPPSGGTKRAPRGASQARWEGPFLFLALPLYIRRGSPNRDCPLLRPSPWNSRSTDAGAAGNVGVVGVIGLGGRRVRRPYTDIPRSPRFGLQRRFMGNVSVRPAPKS